MTDKDIKDYCKNCDVEPPAMRFKCPECEYNPDKKPIDKMIELSEDLGLYKEQIIIDIDEYFKSITDDCGRPITYVVNHNNLREEIITLNKEFARKTQEYNKLLEQHKELDDRANRLIEEKYNLNRECEELKDYARRQENQRETYYKEFLKLSQECEELKLKCLGNRNDYLCERQVTKRYRKALEEIEDICNVADRYELEELQETIFNIIYKAKGEE